MTKPAKHQLWFAVLAGVSLLVGWRALADTISLASHDIQYTHLFLILPISAALILMEWRSLRTVVALSVRTGSVLLAIAVLTACFALVRSTQLSSDALLSMRMLALVLWWIGAFVLCFGSRATR